jgi:hypothetical protein
MRQAADVAGQRPKPERPADLSKAWVAAVSRLVDDIDGLSEALSNPIKGSDPFITQMMVIKQMAWAVRDAAGTDRLMIGAAIAGGNGLPVEQQKQIAILQGRIEAAWKAIEEDIRAPSTPAKLTAAVAAAKSTYFNELGDKRQAIIADLVAGRPAQVFGAGRTKCDYRRD